MSKREDWGSEIQPYDELEDILPTCSGGDDWCYPECDETDDDHLYTRRDPNLDPGFSSWDNYNRWKYL